MCLYGQCRAFYLIAVTHKHRAAFPHRYRNGANSFAFQRSCCRKQLFHRRPVVIPGILFQLHTVWLNNIRRRIQRPAEQLAVGIQQCLCSAGVHTRNHLSVNIFFYPVWNAPGKDKQRMLIRIAFQLFDELLNLLF